MEFTARELKAINAFASGECKRIIDYVATESPQGGPLADDAFEAFIRGEVFRVFEAMLGTSLRAVKENGESTMDIDHICSMGELRERMSDTQVLEHIHSIDRDKIDDAQLKFLDDTLLGVAHKVIEKAEDVIAARGRDEKGKS